MYVQMYVYTNAKIHVVFFYMFVNAAPRGLQVKGYSFYIQGS